MPKAHLTGDLTRSKIINRSFPRPLDKDIESIYKSYISLGLYLIAAWKDEVRTGMVGQRNYYDLIDLRADITATGELVFRFRPVLSEEAEEQVKFFSEFFRIYNRLTDVLITKLQMGSDAGDFKVWKQYNNKYIHQLVMALKFMVAAVNNNKITKSEELAMFEEILNPDQNPAIVEINRFMRRVGWANLVSRPFVQGDASFYQHPDARLVQAYWDYAERRLRKYP